MSPLTQYHVTTFLPNSDSLREAITSCVSGLTALGFEVTQADAQLVPHAVNVVLTSGADEALRHNISSIAHVIVYNWEQILPSVPWVNLDYFKLLKSHHVWDYSASNVAALKAAGICNIHHLKMAYAPQMTRFESQAEPDIDVLFYGNINPRRQAVIDAIRAKGLHVVTSNDVEGGLHGAVRDQYLARAKMVLNLHGQDESTAFEIARVSYLLANKKTVVSEINAGNDIDDDLRRAIIGAPLEQIPQLLCLVSMHARCYTFQSGPIPAPLLNRRMPLNNLTRRGVIVKKTWHPCPSLQGFLPRDKTCSPRPLL